jgi:hypothetical protein
MALTWSAIGHPFGSNKMPAQLKKNFIGIVSDQTEEQRVVESLAKSNRVLSRYLRDLMAAALNRQSEAG